MRAQARLQDGWPAAAFKDARASAKACKGIPGSEELRAFVAKFKNDETWSRALRLDGVLDTATTRALNAKTVNEARAIVRDLEAKIRGTILEPRLDMLLR